MNNKIDTSKLDSLIYGRVYPQIYAFKTNNIPNYLKVGDTYRPLRIRIREWEKIYPKLNLVYSTDAFVNNNRDVYFRDYSVHSFLLAEGKNKLSNDELKDIDSNLYYSNEFFENTTKEDLVHAINEIKNSYPSQEFDYYSILTSSKPREFKYQRTENYNPRPNQKETIENFITAVNKKHNKLLMYAVMRFGKTVTSYWCAKEMDAKVVVVVSGKAEVRDEWQKTLESHVDFGSPEYVFITTDKLKADDKLITNILSSGKRVVLFLTLQDLLKNTNKIDEDLIKAEHKELFTLSSENKIDLLIVDETHFGVRAEKFGKVLSDDSEDIDVLYKVPKLLKANVVLHLSGTPYKILMDTEFSEEQIIAFYQFSDILDDKIKWDNSPENLEKDEWDNPYYGFPEMIRFAFNLNEKSKKILNTYKEKGLSFSLSDMFKTISIRKDNINKKHELFVHHEEVLDFLFSIDSKEEQNIFPFLNHKKIKEGKLCQHMVFVMPFRSSCDAIERMIIENKEKFKNLGSYEIVNISGHNQKTKYHNERGVANIKSDISRYANENKKTITLTVNRMLTGTTVKEWDTMVYLKPGFSPQSYDQAIYRLQNPWIRKHISDIGETIKYNMKPQTLLIDFDIARLFLMVEEKAKIYNVNINEKGNEELEKRIKKELDLSPLVWINNDKLSIVESTDIINAIRDYSSNKSVIDEATNIPVDLTILSNDLIFREIFKQNKIISKNVLEINPTDGVEKGLDFDTELLNESSKSGSTFSNHKEKESERNSLKEKIKTYYSRILFFSFLTKSKIMSLKNLIEVFDESEDNQRIAYNLELKKDILIEIIKEINPFVLSALDYKIYNINSLSRDISKTKIERAKIAIKHFDRFSSSEINTPEATVKKLTCYISDEDIKEIMNNNGFILDISSKSGEFATEFFERAISIGIARDVISNRIISIPTSKFAYEFTRKTYEILGLNAELIPQSFNSYTLIEKYRKNKKSAISLVINLINYSDEGLFNKGSEQIMKFDIVIGNPPYQDNGGSGGSNDAPMYHHFVNLANELNPRFNSMIIPARWFSGGRENLLSEFRSNMLRNKSLKSIYVYTNASDVFSNVEIKGGVCFYVIDKLYDGLCDYTYDNKGKIFKSLRKLDTLEILIRDPIFNDLVEKVLDRDNRLGFVNTIISGDTPFGIPSNPKKSKKNPFIVKETKTDKYDLKVYLIEKMKRKIEYIDRNNIVKNTQDIDKYKVFIPVAGGSGNDDMVLGKPVLAPKNSVCSQSYLYASFDTKIESKNFLKYLKTKFLRALVASIKTTPQATSSFYRFVPLQDFTSNSPIPWDVELEKLDDYLFELYNLSDEIISYIKENISYRK